MGTGVNSEVEHIAQTLRLSGVTEDHQVLKLSEEVGEAVQAYFGWLGTNPRKGVTHTRDEFLDELADVALAALTTLAFFDAPPLGTVCDRLDAVTQRWIDVRKQP